MRFEIRTARNGQPYAVIVGANNRVVWQTETYKDPRHVYRAIEIARDLGYLLMTDDELGLDWWRRVVDRRRG